MRSLDFTVTGRARRDPEPQRLSPFRRAPVQMIVDMDFAAVELRSVARALERRAARCGDDSSDPFDLSPVDFA